MKCLQSAIGLEGERKELSLGRGDKERKEAKEARGPGMAKYHYFKGRKSLVVDKVSKKRAKQVKTSVAGLKRPRLKRGR